ncbi:MAG: hypothetical protein ABIT16_07185 [Croceibacterium sp.]
MRCNPALLLIPVLAACATAQGSYPSLDLRDAERAAGTLQPVEPAPYVPPATPSAVLGQLDQLAAAAASANSAFAQETPRVRSAVAAARGANAGSDSWAEAQVALAGLEASRSKAMIALADLDRLYVDAALAGAEVGRINTVRETVATQVRQQDQVVSDLLGTLR